MELQIKISKCNGRFTAHIECGGSTHGCIKPTPQAAVNGLLSSPWVWTNIVKCNKEFEAWLPAVKAAINH